MATPSRLTDRIKVDHVAHTHPQMPVLLWDTEVGSGQPSGVPPRQPPVPSTEQHQGCIFRAVLELPALTCPRTLRGPGTRHPPSCLAPPDGRLLLGLGLSPAAFESGFFHSRLWGLGQVTTQAHPAQSSLFCREGGLALHWAAVRIPGPKPGEMCQSSPAKDPWVHSGLPTRPASLARLSCAFCARGWCVPQPLTKPFPFHPKMPAQFILPTNEYQVKASLCCVPAVTGIAALWGAVMILSLGPKTHFHQSKAEHREIAEPERCRVQGREKRIMPRFKGGMPAGGHTHFLGALTARCGQTQGWQTKAGATERSWRTCRHSACIQQGRANSSEKDWWPEQKAQQMHWAPFQVCISKDEMRMKTQPREIN